MESLTHEEKKSRIINRIEKNYDDFQNSLYGINREKLINMARRIAAVTETYEMLTEEYEWSDVEEIDFFLLFRDPLTIIADAWENIRNIMSDDFNDAMDEIMHSSFTITEYPLIEGVEMKLYGSVTSFPK